MNILTLSNADKTITNSDIARESLTLTESLCSAATLKFGSCEASVLKLRIRTNDTVLNETFDVTMQEGSKVTSLGSFTVYNEKLTADRCYRDIEAYNAMYDILNAEVSDWYVSLEFPLTLKQFRDSFFEQVGIEQEEATLPNDAMTVEKTIDPSYLSGKDVITSICELNGCFGQVGRDGIFHYSTLEVIRKGLVPALNLFPSSSLHPSQNNADYDFRKEYKDCSFSDFTTALIDKLQIRQDRDDIGAIVGTGTNCYIVQGNFLLYGKNADDLQAVANNLLPAISNIAYTPIKASIQGQAEMIVGEIVKLNTSQGSVFSYVLKRTLKGIQSLNDSIVADGSEYQSEQVGSINNEIIQLRGKTNKLVRNVDGLTSEIYDAETGTSRITQNATAITTKVSKDSIVSEINQTAEAVTISASKIDLNGLVTATEFTTKFATISELNSATARISSLESDHVTTQQLNAVSGTVSTLSGEVASLGTVVANKIDSTTVYAQFMEVTNWVEAGYIKASKISASSITSIISNASSIRVKYLDIDGSKIRMNDGKTELTLIQATVGGKSRYILATA